MTMKWRCTVCGYIHEGDEPPDICPVCGSGSEKFVPYEEHRVGLLRDMVRTFQPHAVAAHFPNALLPTAVLFILIALALQRSTFELAAYYLLVVLLCAAPATLATGLREWKIRFDGRPAPVFRKKIAFASALIILAAVTVGLRVSHPEILLSGGSLRYVYLLLVFAMLGCVAMLGHYGGKLVMALMGKDEVSSSR